MKMRRRNVIFQTIILHFYSFCLLLFIVLRSRHCFFFFFKLLVFFCCLSTSTLCKYECIIRKEFIRISVDDYAIVCKRMEQVGQVKSNLIYSNIVHFRVNNYAFINLNSINKPFHSFLLCVLSCSLFFRNRKKKNYMKTRRKGTFC